MSFGNPDDGRFDGQVDITELDKSMQRFGDSNGRWKKGRSKSYRRRVTKAKPGEVVHHKDKNKNNNKKSNFQKMTPAQHNKVHKEKGGHNRKKKKS